MHSSRVNHIKQTSHVSRNDQFHFHLLLKHHRCSRSSPIFFLHPQVPFFFSLSLLIIMNSIGLYKFQFFFFFFLQISTSSNHFFHSFWILHSWTTWVCFIIDANTRRIIMFIYVFSFFSVIWRRFSDMLGLTTAHQHLPLQCLILFLVLPSSLLFFSGSFSALILTISNAGDE